MAILKKCAWKSHHSKKSSILFVFVTRHFYMCVCECCALMIHTFLMLLIRSTTAKLHSTLCLMIPTDWCGCVVHRVRDYMCVRAVSSIRGACIEWFWLLNKRAASAHCQCGWGNGWIQILVKPNEKRLPHIFSSTVLFFLCVLYLTESISCFFFNFYQNEFYLLFEFYLVFAVMFNISTVCNFWSIYRKLLQTNIFTCMWRFENSSRQSTNFCNTNSPILVIFTSKLVLFKKIEKFIEVNPNFWLSSIFLYIYRCNLNSCQYTYNKLANIHQCNNKILE